MPQSKRVIDELSMQHADLCVQIGFWQRILQSPNDNKQPINHDLYMTREWMFDEKNLYGYFGSLLFIEHP